MIIKPFKTLKHTFVVVVLPVITFITITLFLMLHWSNYKTNHSMLLSKMDFQLRTQSLSFAVPLWNIDKKSISTMFDLLITDNDIAGISIVHENGDLFVSTGVLENKNLNQIEELIKQNNANQISFLNFFKHIYSGFDLLNNKIYYLTKSIPININIDGYSLNIGTLFLTISDESFNTLFNKQFHRMLIIFLIILTMFSASIIFSYNKIIENKLLNLKSSIINARKKQGEIDKEVNMEELNEIDFIKYNFDELWNNQKQLEKELLDSKLRFEEYINLAPIPMLLIDADQNILLLNEKFNNQYGYTSEDLPTLKHWWRNAYPDEALRQEAADYWNERHSLSTDSSKKYEPVKREITVKDRSRRFIELYSTFFDGFSVIAMIDITKRIGDEREKAVLTEQLNHKSRMDAIGQIASGIAHDFNNVLSGIIGSAQLLQLKEKSLSEKGQKYINTILNASETASLLTNKLLLFSRKKSMDKKIFDIQSVINETVEILENTVDKKITIKVIESDEKLYVSGDSSSIQNVLINIFINSSQAMPDGGEIRISTKLIHIDNSAEDYSFFESYSGDYVNIRITDNGSGIPEEYLDKIFDPFFTTKEIGKGTGLGLATAYGIIKDHYGEIRAESQVDKGTAFDIYLPASEFSENHENLSGDISAGTGMILFVDDEEHNRELGLDILESLGYEVMLASDGLEACELYKNNINTIDLVILDYMMPNMNGKETFLKIKEINLDCKIILASGYIENDDILEMREKGLSAEIHKPYTINELSTLLEKVMIKNTE